jgi:two-component system, cell cycle response regulator DivK
MDKRQAPLVLIVDDSAGSREMYAQYLRFHGYEIAEADNGQEALKQAAALQPDVIVMDLSLPGMDGWEATRRLKQEPLTRDIPVIALTGHVLTGSEHTAREAGCDLFLTKPCAPAVLGQEIRKLLPGVDPEQRS